MDVWVKTQRRLLGLVGTPLEFARGSLVMDLIERAFWGPVVYFGHDGSAISSYLSIFFMVSAGHTLRCFLSFLHVASLLDQHYEEFRNTQILHPQVAESPPLDPLAALIAKSSS